MNTSQQSVDSRIEELRATGLHGQEPWVTGLEPALGRSVAILRQSEIYAEQMASVCLDADLNELNKHDTWQIVRSGFLSQLNILVSRLGECMPEVTSQLNGRANAIFDSQWPKVQSLASRLNSDSPATVDCAEIVVPLLFTILELQAAVHDALRPGGTSEATRLAPSFLQRCRERLGRPLPGATSALTRGEMSVRSEAAPSSG